MIPTKVRLHDLEIIGAWNALSLTERDAQLAATDQDFDAALEKLEEHITQIATRNQPNTHAGAEFECSNP